MMMMTIIIMIMIIIMIIIMAMHIAEAACTLLRLKSVRHHCLCLDDLTGCKGTRQNQEVQLLAMRDGKIRSCKTRRKNKALSYNFIH